MRGRPCAAIASCVTSGTASRVAKRIGDALRADQPAAVIAISGFSEVVTITARDGLPATVLANVSIARAVSSAVGAVTSTALRPSGRGTSPTRTTCAPPASAEPLGAQGLERVARRTGHLGPVGQEDRRAQRRTRKDGSRERTSPVPAVCQHDRRGPLPRIHRTGDRGGGLRRIGGIDPGCVLRGRCGNTERGRIGPAGWCGSAVAGSSPATEATGAGDDEDEQESQAPHWRRE